MHQMILDLAPPPAPTLENFFTGRNATAAAAIRSALQSEERQVYLWGVPGAGKTHLLQAFVAGMQSRGLRAQYAIAPHFEASSATDALAADDVERLDIVGQLAAFDLYNQLRAKGCVVAAGDRPPRDLPLREDLRTRIGAGLVLQVHPLSEEEKRVAMLDHAARRGLKLGIDILDHLLTRHARDMGTLVSLIDALDRYSLQTRRPITLPLLREALRNQDP